MSALKPFHNTPYRTLPASRRRVHRLGGLVAANVIALGVLVVTMPAFAQAQSEKAQPKAAEGKDSHVTAEEEVNDSAENEAKGSAKNEAKDAVETEVADPAAPGSSEAADARPPLATSAPGAEDAPTDGSATPAGQDDRTTEGAPSGQNDKTAQDAPAEPDDKTVEDEVDAQEKDATAGDVQDLPGVGKIDFEKGTDLDKVPGKKVVVEPSSTTPVWQDADRIGVSVSRGAIGVCESATAPLVLIPYIGFGTAWLIEFACIIPGAISLDYVKAQHGDDPNGAWFEGAAALTASKLWKDATTIPVYIAASTVLGVCIAAAGVGLLATTIVFPFAALWVFVPAAIGAMAATTGAAWVGAEFVRDAGTEFIFWTVLEGFGGYDDVDLEATLLRRDSTERSFLQPQPGTVARTWALASIGSGVKPEFEYAHLIPVAGPILFESDRADRLKAVTHRAARDVFQEEKTASELELAHDTIDYMTTASGIVGAGSQALLAIAAGAVVGAGVSTAFIGIMPVIAGPALVVCGVVSLASGLLGLTGLGLRKLVDGALPYAFAASYGIFPDETPGRADEVPANDAPKNDAQQSQAKPERPLRILAASDTVTY